MIDSDDVFERLADAAPIESVEEAHGSRSAWVIDPFGHRWNVGTPTFTPGQIEMWFTVRDFDDAVERVRVAGGTVVDLNAWDSGREATCEDDQGVTFKLSEPAPGYDR
jgi:hypothetical protein